MEENQHIQVGPEIITNLELMGFIERHNPTLGSRQTMLDFAQRVYNNAEKPGTWVPNDGIPLDIANEITSIICQHYERTKRTKEPVLIKKVAELRGSRFNIGKLRTDLIDPLAMQGLAAVLTKGAVKYSAHNWRQGMPYMEIIASLLRHTFAVMRGEDNDPETGEYHADHIQCNAMFLSNMMKTRPDMDDRWKPNPPQGESS